MESLRNWRQIKSKELNLHIGVVFPANLLENLALTPPANLQEMSEMPGIRQWRVREFGEDLLQIVQNPDPQNVDTSGK
jgi:ribonuclease D